MNVLFLIEGVTVPASRYRILQLLPHLRALGVRATVRHGYGQLYNGYQTTALGAPYKLVTRLRRVVGSLDAGRFDLVFSQRPALPFSALPEQLIATLNPRTIFDFDDHLGVGADGQISQARVRAFTQIIACSRHIIAGNRFLAALTDASARTSVIPTVVDTDRYIPPPKRSNSAPIIIGWMGTASNFASLRLILAPLCALLRRNPGVMLRIVSNAVLPELAAHKQVEQIPWSAERELELLQSFDLGLMPLEDTVANKGKCGFKMLQYMSVGTPVVVSAVGANVEIFDGSHAGACIGAAGWVESIELLLSDHSLLARCGEAGRAHVESRYSIKSVMPAYRSLFELV